MSANPCAALNPQTRNVDYICTLSCIPINTKYMKRVLTITEARQAMHPWHIDDEGGVVVHECVEGSEKKKKNNRESRDVS